MKKIINVFIVSPTDVNTERNIAKDVCFELDTALGKDIEINPILWEYHPMSYHKNVQENINIELDKCDIFVVILWHRLGSIVEGYEGAITKSKNVTGTQYEIEKILASKKESVFFYFKTEDKKFSTLELDEALKQRQLLDTFLEDINLVKGSTKHGYQEFKDSAEFKKKFRSHLRIELEKQTDKKIKRLNPKSIMGKYINIFFVLMVGIFILNFVLEVGGNKNNNSLLQKEVYTQKKIESSLANQDRMVVYLDIEDKVDDEIRNEAYNYLIEALASANIDVSKDETKSIYKVEVTQDMKETEYIVSDMPIVKTQCTLYYVIVKLDTMRIIQSKNMKNEMTHFKSDDREIECFSGLYKSMLENLVGTLTGI